MIYLIIAFLLAACRGTVGAAESTPTALADPTDSVTSTAAPTLPPPDITETHLLWQWTDSVPAALVASGDQVVVLTTDGSAVWLDAETGERLAEYRLWSGIIEGAVTGEVYSDEERVIVTAHQNPLLPGDGFQSRVVVFDGLASESWSLPELSDQRYYLIAPTGDELIAAASSPDPALPGLSAFDLDSGDRLWQIENGEALDIRQLTAANEKMFALFDVAEGGRIDARLVDGTKWWEWIDPSAPQPDHLLVSDTGLYVMGVSRVQAFDPERGTPRWWVDLAVSPEAGFAAAGDNLHLVPAPTAETEFRSGVVSLDASSGNLTWHALGGMLVEAIVVQGDTLWVLTKDIDRGTVSLSGLEALTGLERVRLEVEGSPDSLYRLAAGDRNVYVLGDSLYAFGS
ncbi:MAG: PQQ-binding-like beta-propeller repeat protein [Anaerolineae bacterium]|nr:PQQ-binding-like beta-propeller repeat protein [Anaerolineae bacterium]